MPLFGIKPPLALSQHRVHGQVVIEGVFAHQALAGVGRQAGDLEHAGHRPGVGHDELGRAVAAGRLGDDGRIREPAASDRRQRAQAAVLLRRNGDEDHPPRKIARAAGEHLERLQRRDQARFHVRGAAPVEAVVLDHTGEGIARPLAVVARRHHVHMPGEQDGGPGPGAADGASDHRHPGALDLVPGVIRVDDQLADAVIPVIDLGVAGAQPVGDAAYGGLLLAGHRRNAHQVHQPLPQPLTVDECRAIVHQT